MNNPSKPLAKPGTGHKDGCNCTACTSWRRAVVEAAALKARHMQQMQLQAKGAAQARKEVKHEDARRVIDEDVRRADERVRRIEAARAAADNDLRARRLLELRAQGWGMREAMAQVEAEFDQQTNERS